MVVSRERAESVLGMVQMFGFAKVKKIVVGGAKRSASMAAGLEHVAEDAEYVCVHDASWPMVSSALIADTVKAARRHGSGVAAREMSEPVVAAKKGVVISRQDEGGALWEVVSPQTWPREALAKVYARGSKDRGRNDEDMAVMMAQGIAPRLVPVSGLSLRIRSAEDLAPVLALMK